MRGGPLAESVVTDLLCMSALPVNLPHPRPNNILASQLPSLWAAVDHRPWVENQLLPSPTQEPSRHVQSMCKGTRILWIQRTSTPSNPPFQRRQRAHYSPNKPRYGSRLFALLRKPASTITISIWQFPIKSILGFPPVSHCFVVSSSLFVQASKTDDDDDDDDA